MSIPIVGKCFGTTAEFLAYLDGVTFSLWRPRFVTMHHTGAPDLKTWQGWQTRAKPVTDDQWMKNLAVYYGAPPLNWRSGPHFFFTPKHFCVLSPPNARGVHAVSFNAVSWGVECVGDFDREPFTGAVRDRYVEGLAVLHIASGLQPQPFERGVRGLHFHRDDPKTNKTCPGKNVDKAALIAAIQYKIAELTVGDHPAEEIVEKPAPKRAGVVSVPSGETLNVRAAASAKAPLVLTLKPGDKVSVTGAATNGETAWLSIDIPGEAGGWVAARYVDVT